MAAAHPDTDTLSRVRREQRRRGKKTENSGLRIVLAATAITLGVLLFAFGAIGFLMLARGPQEPLAGKFDPPLPDVQQSKAVPPSPKPEPARDVAIELPPPATVSLPTQAELERQVAAQNAAEPAATETPVPEAEPETTATVPDPSTQTEEQAAPKKKAAVHQRRPQHYVRRQPPQSQSDNPLLQLFGIRQYR